MESNFLRPGILLLLITVLLIIGCFLYSMVSSMKLKKLAAQKEQEDKILRRKLLWEEWDRQGAEDRENGARLARERQEADDLHKKTVAENKIKAEVLRKEREQKEHDNAERTARIERELAEKAEAKRREREQKKRDEAEATAHKERERAEADRKAREQKERDDAARKAREESERAERARAEKNRVSPDIAELLRRAMSNAAFINASAVVQRRVLKPYAEDLIKQRLTTRSMEELIDTAMKHLIKEAA